ncbi:hypothetical protein [Peribacillus muralis]|uniref:hypothetical protein n=1 Tax=Peribacillus muralis TaxID=264697 RepID=UPI00070D06B8|nr:hypothetical protein [Peribacillus muralis]
MSNPKSTAKILIVYNAISLGIILLIQVSAPSIGKALLNSKIEFTNEDAAYWVARSIEVDTVQGFCLLFGLLNISLIAVAVNHLLRGKN